MVVMPAGAPNHHLCNRDVDSLRDSAYRRQPERPFGLADPAPDGGIAIEMEAALVRDPRIGQQRNVGQRDRVANQERRQRELMFHPRQREIAALDLVRIEVSPLCW